MTRLAFDSTMSVSVLTYSKNLEGIITILGECGAACVGGIEVNEIQLSNFDAAADRHAAITWNDKSIFGFGHPPYCHNAMEVLRSDAELKTDGREGLKSLELLIPLFSWHAMDGQCSCPSTPNR